MVCANVIMSNFFLHHSSFTYCIFAINLHNHLHLQQSLILGPHPPVQPAKPGAVLIRQIRAYVSILHVLCNDIDIKSTHDTYILLI